MKLLLGSLIISSLLSISSVSAQNKAELISIDGSSTVFPTTEAVAEEFQKANRNVRVTVGISGTGGGFKKFCRGETALQNASRPIVSKEMEDCKKAGVRYLELPVAFDALTVVVNKRNNNIQCMTVQELKKLWEPNAQGQITTWNQIRPNLPNAKISLYGAGSDSGTFDYFTEAVVGKAKSSRGDFTASEDDNVLVQGVTRDINALGYIPFAYVAGHSNQLKTVAIDNGKGCVEPKSENVVNGSYQPLSRPLFIYVNLKELDRPMVQKFVEFYLSDKGQTLIKEVKYVPLPQLAYDTGYKRILNRVPGTAFAGHAEIGLSIEEIVKRTPVE